MVLFLLNSSKIMELYGGITYFFNCFGFDYETSSFIATIFSIIF